MGVNRMDVQGRIRDDALTGVYIKEAIFFD
jgi:hypothetical protein